MNAVIDAAINRSRTILLTLALILTAGVFTYIGIPKEAEPDINIPIIYVSMSHEGISPEDAERLLVRPMEQELRSIEGIKEMRSTAAEGFASVLLEFEAGFDADKAIGGDRDEMLEIVVDAARLESYRISQQDLLNAVILNIRLVAAGALDTGAGRFAVKVPGLFKTARDVLDLPIKVQGDGVVTLEDVTSVRRTFRDATSYARLDGETAVTLEVRKRLGFNIIETINGVRRAVAEEQATWPVALKATFFQDKADDVRVLLSDLQNNVIAAILLVMIVVVAALGIRSAVLVGVAIPGSFLIAILYLFLFGFTMNMVVLYSLILAVGMLVDGAIVVTEFADRKMAEGNHRRHAYEMAAKRMAWPITASTATTLAAFMPLLFWPGVVGEFMKFLPITLVLTLSGSLLMALVFVPTLGSKIGKVGATDAKTLRTLAETEAGDLAELGGFTGLYARALSGLVNRTWRAVAVVASAVVLLFGIQIYYALHGNGVEFFPDVDSDNALVLIHARGNLSTNEKDALVREVEERVLALDEFDAVYARTGAASEGQEQSEDVIGTISLELKHWQQRRPASEILADLRARTRDLAGIEVEMRKPESGPPTGKDIRLQLASRFPELLPAAVEKIRRHLATVDGLVDIEDSRPVPGIEWEITVDRSQAGRFGTDIASVGNVVQLVTNGIKVGEYRPNDADEEIDIRVRLPLEERTVSQLDTLKVQTRDGLVPISNFVTRQARPKVSAINRVDGRRVLEIKANVVEGVLADTKVKEISAWLAGAGIHPDIEVAFKGADEEQKEASAFLTKAFAVALFIMAIILVTQFNRIYYAFLILTAVVRSTIGVMIGLIVTGQPFGVVMTGVGVITLAGIVVNNNIVLIDTFARLRKSGMAPLEAVVRTGAQRLRPVLLTAITSVFGLLPMVLGVNINFLTREMTVGAPSSQWWIQLSTAIVSGLTFATLLTLVMTPCLLALGARTGAWVEARRAGRAGILQPAE